MPPLNQARAGTPGPDRWIRHTSLEGDHRKVENVAALGAGEKCAEGVAMSALVVCAGASRGRCRFKATVAGELKLEFLRPLNSNTVIPYEAGNPAPVTVVANTETLLSTSDLAGEASALITFTPTGAGVVTFCDWMAL